MIFLKKPVPTILLKIHVKNETLDRVCQKLKTFTEGTLKECKNIAVLTALLPWQLQCFVTKILRFRDT